MLEVALAPQQLARRLRTDPLGARQAVGGVAAQRDEVRHLLRTDAVHPPHRLGVHLVRPLLARALEQDGDGVVHALEHVAVAGEYQRVAAGLGLGDGQRVQEVVRLEILVVRHGPAERAVEVRRPLPLRLQLVGDGRTVGVVVRVRLDAVLGGLGPEAEHHGARRVLLDAPQGLVGRAEQRVDRHPVVVGDRVGQRVEGAVQEVGSVGDEQGLRHRDSGYVSADRDDDRAGRWRRSIPEGAAADPRPPGPGGRSPAAAG